MPEFIGISRFLQNRQIAETSVGGGRIKCHFFEGLIMKTQIKISYEDIISLENLFTAWQEFLPGKRKKQDVQEFGVRLTDNILQLQGELANFSYIHGPYKAFNISDPKPRNIHKATVRDRVLHHAIYRKCIHFSRRFLLPTHIPAKLVKGRTKQYTALTNFIYKLVKITAAWFGF